jgi:hypothetical protein
MEVWGVVQVAFYFGKRLGKVQTASAEFWRWFGVAPALCQHRIRLF